MTDQDTPGPDNELADAASDAWLYFTPLLLMQLTRQVEADVELTTWAHSEAFRTAEFTSVIRPNLDTRYSHAWLDLSAGPVLLSAPDTDGRYYVVQAMDAWTRTFATVGTRTTGDQARSVVFVPPDHEASEPDRADPWPSDALVIPAPTDRVWLLLRVQSNGVDDGAAIVDLQVRFVLRAVGESGAEAAGEAPESGWLTPEVIANLGNGTPPPEILTEMDAETFFGWASERWGGPGLALPAEDAAFVSRAAALGLRSGRAAGTRTGGTT